MLRGSERARGNFTTEDPIELIVGELLEYPRPQSAPHAAPVQLVALSLKGAVGPAFFVSQRTPVRLGSLSMPEPDVAVVRGRVRDFSRAHPTSAELIVEVADSSLALDRGRKLRLYAREGIREYWIVHLADDCVEVRRQPVGEDYAETRTFRRVETITVGPQSAIVAVNDLLP